MAVPKKLKVGVKEGGGVPPGYEWNVLIFDRAYNEAISFLDASQYRHMAMQVKELAMESEPTKSTTVDVRKIEEFYEIRDKGGPLGGLNVRVFFGVDGKKRSLVVLGAIKKQNDGPTPIGDKVRMRRRWRAYENGDVGSISP